ncbi:MAG TPA: serine hydrolase [Candidatus Limnocylindrales bacterium]|nr:serine hydrolase [Candidatus Limnocylindrales bacterium]
MESAMRAIIFSLFFLGAIPLSFAQGLYFPPLTGNTWETMHPSALGWCPEGINNLNSFLEANGTKAFIVLVDGRIVIEEYYGTFTRDSIWYWASAGKTLTAFLVGLAQQNGQLSLSDRTSRFIGTGWTQASREQEDRITIRHQLNMTTGLDDGVPDNHCTTPSCLLFLANAGTRWAYHNAPYTLLDDVLNAATNQSLNAMVFQNFTQTAGITGLFVKSGFNNVFFSRARSMARFGLLMLNRGNWNGNQILTDMAFFDDMITPSQSFNQSYGYLWWLNGRQSYMLPQLRNIFAGWLSPSAPPDMYSALGKNGQILNVIPSLNMVMVRMGNDPETGFVPALLNNEIWKRMNALACSPTRADANPADPRFAIAPNPATDYVVVSLPGTGYLLEVFDTSGNLIKVQRVLSQTETVPLTGLAPGLYLFRATSPSNQIFTDKVMVRGQKQ